MRFPRDVEDGAKAHDVRDKLLRGDGEVDKTGLGVSRVASGCFIKGAEYLRLEHDHLGMLIDFFRAGVEVSNGDEWEVPICG